MMFKHWPSHTISPSSSCFMYKGALSLYIPSIVAPHNTYIGLRKSCGIIDVIWYMGPSSGFGLSTSFIGPFCTYLSYIVNKHKSMTVNNKNNKNKIPFSEKSYTRCISQARKVLRAYLNN